MRLKLSFSFVPVSQYLKPETEPEPETQEPLAAELEKAQWPAAGAISVQKVRRPASCFHFIWGGGGRGEVAGVCDFSGGKWVWHGTDGNGVVGDEAGFYKETAQECK